MIDFNLRADTRKALDAALATAGLIDEEGNPVSERIMVDYIGPITRQIGFDEKEPVFETIPEYHANLRLLDDATDEQIKALADITVPEPNNPYRVWA